MSQSEVAMLLEAGLLVALKLAGPLLGVSLAVGLVVSLIQAITQINESTLTFVPKIAGAGRHPGAARSVHAGRARGLRKAAVRPHRRDRRLVTAADAALLAALPAWAFAFVLVLARVGAAVMLLPGLGESGPPAMVRVGMAMGVTLLLLPLVQPLIPPSPGAFVPAAGMVMAEVATGLWLGWLARVLVLALPMAGQIVAYMIGLANVLEPDTSLGAHSTALGRLFSLAAAVAVLASGLWAVPVAALAGSFRLIAPGALLPAGDAAAAASAAVAGGFALALRLAAPFVLAAIVWQVASGVVARLIPRLQVYFLTMPAQILGGLLLLALLSGAMLTAWQDALQTGFARLPGLG